MAAIQELEASGLDNTPCPATFPENLQLTEVAYSYMHCSSGEESASGSWASGPSPDGKGEFKYVADPAPMGEAPTLNPAPPMFHGTPPVPPK